MPQAPLWTRRIVWIAAVASATTLPKPAAAHWCSNIFAAHARLIVKPERSSVQVTAGTSTQLRVFLQNNFPYKLFGVQMRGSASGYTVNVTPASQTISPGQQVAYTYSISGGNGTLTSTQLNLQVLMRLGSWRGSSDRMVNPSPSQADLVASSSNFSDQNQAPSLEAAMLADQYASATLPASAPYFGRTGIEQLIHWFGYRFCYTADGAWRCGSQNCPSPCAEGGAWTSILQFPQNCMRAGVDLGIRKAKLGSRLAAAQSAAINAMKAGTDQHKCLAAVVGGHLWRGTADTSAFENQLSSVSAACQAAGLRAVGKGAQSSCSGGQNYEQAACAAAEGLRGNDAVVSSVLVPNAGDGDSCNDYSCLYYAYLLYLVAGDRLAQGSAPSFYPAVGPSPDTGVAPRPDQTVTPPPDKGVTPPRDTAVPPRDRGTFPTPDKGTTPPRDRGVTPKLDAAVVKKDAAMPLDRGATPGGDAALAGDGSVVLGDNGLPVGDNAAGSDATQPRLRQVLEGGCGCRIAAAPAAEQRGSEGWSRGGLSVTMLFAGLAWLRRRSRRAVRRR